MFATQSLGAVGLECRIAGRRLAARPLSSLAVVLPLALDLALVPLAASVEPAEIRGP